MYRVEPTENALSLNSALNAVGIETVLEHWDGHKHIDIFHLYPACLHRGKLQIH